MIYRPSAKSLENLKKGVKFTPATASAAGKKGGPAASAAIKRKKTLADIAAKIAASDIRDDELRAQLKTQYGLEAEDLINNSLVAAGLFRRATEGDVKACEKWEEMLSRDNADAGTYELPARVVSRAFSDINRNFAPGKYIFKGGRGSGKSSYISLKIIELLKNNPELHACVVRRVAATLRDSVYAQLKWAIHELHMDEEWECKVSPLEIRYRKTGQIIYFRGLDDEIKLKSIKPPFGYIGVLWKEEKDQLAGPEQERSVGQSVLRGGDITYDISSYNPPRSVSNWVNQELLTIDDSRIVHHSSYLDVPREWLGQAFLDEAEHLRQVNPDAYEHEYMGAANGTGGQVFDNVECRKITNEEIRRMDKLYMGVDWGFFPDPYAFVVAYYDPAREIIYLIDEYVVNKMRNTDTGAWIQQHYKTLYSAAPFGVVCDAAEQKSIADYQDLGIPATGAWKPPGSVEYGIRWLQARRIVIDQRRTPHAHSEFTKYEYPRDRAGNYISGYVDADNHTIDALRYSLSPLFMRRFSHA